MKVPIPGLVIAGPHGKDTVTLERALGGGAFGIVFQAEDSDGTLCAVKFPQYAVFGGAPEVAAFFNEVQAASHVTHPNVVRVLHVEVNSPDTPPYLIMEYLPDGTLKTRLDSVRSTGGSIAQELLRDWTLELVDGMESINAKMLHRDLKPDNILLAGNTLKIADFGLSKLVGAATRSNTFKGGQHMLYMAPEGWRMENNDIQIDMYACGIVLYEIAALSYPYTLPVDPRDVSGLQRMHFFEQAKSLSSVRTDLPAAFCQVVTKLMEKRPQDRFHTWGEVRDSVQKAFAVTPGTAAAKPIVNSLVGTIGRLHEIQSREQLELQERAVAERDWQKLDEFQGNKLLDEIYGAVDEFNNATPLAKIDHDRRFDSVEFKAPFDVRLQLTLFQVRPPLKLKRGLVRYAAIVADQNDGGLNFLLCRADPSDLYGRWVPLRARIPPLMDPNRIKPRAQPFGFVRGEMNEIEKADHAMHIYAIDYLEMTAGEAFLDAVHQAIERRQSR